MMASGAKDDGLSWLGIMACGTDDDVLWGSDW